MNICFYHSPIGKIAIAEENEKIVRIFLQTDKIPFDAIVTTNSTLSVAMKQLDEYFAGKRKNFSLPIELNGSDFNVKVWQEILKIPYGKTVSYQEIAKKIGKPTACRAIGQAANKNPLPLIIPCHRIIGKNGKLTGFVCSVKVKQKLLDMEKL